MTPWTSPRRLARSFGRLPQTSLLPGRGRTATAGASLTGEPFAPSAVGGLLAEPPSRAIDEAPLSEDLLRTLREAGL